MPIGLAWHSIFAPVGRPDHQRRRRRSPLAGPHRPEGRRATDWAASEPAAAGHGRRDRDRPDRPDRRGRHARGRSRLAGRPDPADRAARRLPERLDQPRREVADDQQPPVRRRDDLEPPGRQPRDQAPPRGRGHRGIQPRRQVADRPSKPRPGSGRLGPGARSGRSRAASAPSPPTAGSPSPTTRQASSAWSSSRPAGSWRGSSGPTSRARPGPCSAPTARAWSLATNDPPSTQVINLRAIRRGLAEIGLDWDAPAFSDDDPARADLPPLPPLTVDYGFMAGHVEHFSPGRRGALRAVHRADQTGARRRRRLPPSRPRPARSSIARRRRSTTCPTRFGSAPTTCTCCTCGPRCRPRASRGWSPRSPTWSVRSRSTPRGHRCATCWPLTATISRGSWPPARAGGRARTGAGAEPSRRRAGARGSRSRSTREASCSIARGDIPRR